MNGLLIVNKEEGYTSRDIVNIVSKKLKTNKVGHTGTLDPLATGVLVVAIGDALKLVDQLTSDNKEYIATVQLGILTDTLDVTGNILEETTDINVTKEKTIEVLNSFLGKSIQKVPIYSAVRVNGKRLYEYAREGLEVEIPKREIEIFDIELLDISGNQFTFRVNVSKGTYIRSLIRDIGIKLGVHCSMKKLNRIKQGDFFIENSYTLNEINNDKYTLIPVVECLNEFEVIKVDKFLESKILNGRILENRYYNDNIAFINNDNNLLALYKIYDKDPEKIKPMKVLNKNKI